MRRAEGREKSSVLFLGKGILILSLILTSSFKYSPFLLPSPMNSRLLSPQGRLHILSSRYKIKTFRNRFSLPRLNLFPKNTRHEI
jgi:hypothetical protein